MTRTAWAVALAVVLVAAAVTAGVVATSGGTRAASAAPPGPANTAGVQEGPLSATVSLDGTLTYRARADGSPYVVVNRARGTYTELPEAGDEVDCGDVLYRVDDRPVLLLCGSVPAYRDLRVGDTGRDVRQLNRNLRRLGYRAGTGDAFTHATATALAQLQHHEGAALTGALRADDAVFLPRPVRIAKVSGEPGGSARPGAEVARATSDTLEVRVDLAASQRSEVRRRDRVQIILPGLRPVTGRVDRVGSVAGTTGKGDDAGSATIAVFIRLGEPAKARGLDGAPVRVEITTARVERALSVPVTALVGRSGGGLAVEVVRAGGRRELVAVGVGLFDTAGGRVQVEGDLRAGDRVVVPSL